MKNPRKTARIGMPAGFLHTRPRIFCVVLPLFPVVRAWHHGTVRHDWYGCCV